jgi:histidine ammonia-lyase
LTESVVVDGSSLTIDKLVKVARLNCRVELARESAARIEKSRSALERLAQEGKTIYGVTTGFGALSHTRITLDQASELQTKLLRSHASGVGEKVPMLKEDRPTSTLIESVATMISHGSILQSVESMIQPLR